MSKLLFTEPEWTIEDLDKTWEEIAKYTDKYKLDIPNVQFELVTYEQMLDINCSNALPNLYHHWSFGKQFIKNYHEYKKGRTGLAYEVIINTDPAFCYLMENNTMLMQCLVMCHAGVGHSNFFKNNYLFKQHTNPKVILPFLEKSRKFIEECEKKFGVGKVEALLDSCHALQYFSFDPFKPKRWTEKKVKDRNKKRRRAEEESQTEFSVRRRKIRGKLRKKHYNLLRYIRDHSKALKSWQRDIISILLEINQYLYPQIRTKIMNEGWASFWHYTLMNDLYKDGKINDGHYLEFIENHTAVIFQPEADSRYYSGINPYKLGFEMFMDLRRICENPTDEDREWFPEIAGSDWLETLKYIAFNYRDDSFIEQFLSPALIRKLRLFEIEDDEENPNWLITDIHNEKGYRKIRSSLATQTNFDNQLPILYIVDPPNIQGIEYGELYIENFEFKGREMIARDTQKTLLHVTELWGDIVRFGVISEEESRPSIMEWQRW